jgi:hypothetical protein
MYFNQLPFPLPSIPSRQGRGKGVSGWGLIKNKLLFEDTHNIENEKK